MSATRSTPLAGSAARLTLSSACRTQPEQTAGARLPDPRAADRAEIAALRADLRALSEGHAEGLRQAPAGGGEL